MNRRGKRSAGDQAIEDALRRGNPAEVRALIAGGVDLASYRTEGGYDALLTALFGRDLVADENLLPLLQHLIAAGVPLNGESSYGESALSVLSRVCRFDAVSLLLQAGADQRLLAWTPLLRAVALGDVDEVRQLIADATDLEVRDRWARTPFLLALATGRTEIAVMLADAGANQDAKDRAGRSALFHAVASRRTEPVQWLLSGGVDVDVVDDGGNTVLADAVENDDLPMVDLLLVGGADPNHPQLGFSALASSRSREVASRLLGAGADPAELGYEVQRLFTGKSRRSGNQALEELQLEDFERDRTRRFGAFNPELMQVPFWLAMISSGVSGFEGVTHFGMESDRERPVWCAQRFGQSMTLLPDGRVVQVGGEHEDGYDPDFCIYNDVFVHDTDGTVSIFGYPKEVFPPTDFHTATLVGERILLIGSLAYADERAYGSTPVYGLDTRTWQIEHFPTSGDAPGWIYKHRACLRGDHEIVVTGGTILSFLDGKEQSETNQGTFVLDMIEWRWRRERPS